MIKQEMHQQNNSLNSNNEDSNETCLYTTKMNKIIENSNKISQKEYYTQSKKKAKNQNLKKVEIPEFKNSDKKANTYSNKLDIRSNYLILRKFLQESQLLM